MYNVNIKDFKWVNDLTLQFLQKDYLLEGQSFEDRIQIILQRFEELIGPDKKELVEKFLKYFKAGYYSLSTPVWTNYGTTRGLPISCFNTHISDSMNSILYGVAEIGMMSKYGGGTSAYLDVRGRGAKIKDNGNSSGIIMPSRILNEISNSISQGKTRRGSTAVYLDIDHPDILEFLAFKSDGNPIQDLSFGVSVSDDFMNRMIDGDSKARKVWAKVIESRFNTGYPYIFFRDTVNNNKPQVYKDHNLEINGSNLCSEICLPSTDTESFICCLSSMNALHFDEWKDTDAVEVLTYFLDTVIEDFILGIEREKAKLKLEYGDNEVYTSFMDRPLQFAKRHRAIGIGVLGLASYYQSKMIPFESLPARLSNIMIFKTIDEKSLNASKQLATWFGEPELLKGYGVRNTTRMAVAPTKSSSFLLGQVSEGIEPWRANSYIKDLNKLKVTVRNIYLTKLLEKKGKNTVEVWNSIDKKAGSVQHLDFLTDEEKEVFKTMEEISPLEIITQAAQRQKYIDQAASTNLLINPKTPVKHVNALMIEAWKMGVKTLYYQHNVNSAQEFSRGFLEDCTVCSA